LLQRETNYLNVGQVYIRVLSTKL